ncbi:MAG: hypothetical protein R2798_07635 [Chitinophagales bacterium]|nr:hypothetical protein [Bacteroidota bacterium]MCB9042307.1 hypothetical protein [Chitinophagales bacterium]
MPVAMKNYWKVVLVFFIIIFVFSGCRTTKAKIDLNELSNIGGKLSSQLPDTIDGRRVILLGMTNGAERFPGFIKSPDSISPKRLDSILRKHKLVLVPDTLVRHAYKVRIDTNILYKNRMYPDNPIYDMDCKLDGFFFTGYLYEILDRIEMAYNYAYGFQVDAIKLIIEDETTYEIANKYRYDILIDYQYLQRNHGPAVFVSSCFYEKYGIRLMGAPDQDEKIPVYYLMYKFEAERLHPKKKRKSSPKTP